MAADAKNEILVGNAGPWQPGDNVTYPGSLNIFDPVTQQLVLTILDPEQRAGSGFGQGAIQIGDVMTSNVNNDGLMDFAATAGFWSGPLPSEGRLYILRSDISPSPPSPGPPAWPQGAQGLAGPAGSPWRTGFCDCSRGSHARTLRICQHGQERQRVRLLGALETFVNAAACERGVLVRIQQRSGSTPR